MLNLEQKVDTTNNCPSFRRTVYNKGRKSLSSRTDFNFWDDKGRKKICGADNVAFESSQIEFQIDQTDGYTAYSPPFFSSTRHEVSTLLLPNNHHHSFNSSKSQSQVIADGRKEIMELVQNMPDESSYELSLKDIVDDLIKIQDADKKIEKKNYKSSPRKQMLRSQSMDSGVFLLKMFFPTWLCWKKKQTLGNESKVSRMTSFNGYEKPTDKEWWSVRFLVSKKNKNSSSTSSNSSGSTSCSRSRNSNSSYSPCCWTSDNLCESRKQKGRGLYGKRI